MDDQDDSVDWTLDELEASIKSHRLDLPLARKRDFIRTWVQPFFFLAAVALIFTTSDGDRAWPWLVAVMVVNHLMNRFMEPTADQVSSEYSRLRAMKRLKLLRKELDEQRGPVLRGGARPIWRPAPEGRLQLVAAAQGDGSRSVEVVRWLVEPGALVTEKQPIAQVQYDAATIEFPADRAGRIGELLVPACQDVPIDTVLCELKPNRPQD